MRFSTKDPSTQLIPKSTRVLWERPILGTHLKDHAIRLLGVTEADIRSITPEYMKDGYTVKLWNHRSFFITGREIVISELVLVERRIRKYA